jgi:hypothetical protein
MKGVDAQGDTIAKQIYNVTDMHNLLQVRVPRRERTTQTFPVHSELVEPSRARIVLTYACCFPGIIVARLKHFQSAKCLCFSAATNLGVFIITVIFHR